MRWPRAGSRESEREGNAVLSLHWTSNYRANEWEKRYANSISLFFFLLIFFSLNAQHYVFLPFLCSLDNAGLRQRK